MDNTLRAVESPSIFLDNETKTKQNESLVAKFN